MISLDADSQIQTDVIGYSEGIPVAVENVIRIVKIKLAYGVGYRTACLVGEIQGCTITFCKSVIGDQADVMRPVVIRGEKFPVVDPFLWKFTVKANKRTGIRIPEPTVEFALCFLKEKFDSIGPAITLDNFGFYGIV